MSDTIYDTIFRHLHPRVFPYSSRERQRELRDLRPSEQEKFKRQVDATIRALEEQEQGR